MNEFDKLELSTETLRELSGDELGRVAGGVNQATQIACEFHVTYLCPSGETWTANCQITYYCPPTN
jgi:hypothetical protein